MTTEVNKLSDEELNRKLAECLGWQTLKREDGWSESVCASHMAKPNEDAIASPPKLTASLDACAEVERTLTDEQCEEYIFRYLPFTSGAEKREQGPIDLAILALSTARQRAEALYLTLTQTQ